MAFTGRSCGGLCAGLLLRGNRNAGNKIPGAGFQAANRYVKNHFPSHRDHIHIAADNGVLIGNLHPEIRGVLGKILLHHRGGDIGKFPVPAAVHLELGGLDIVHQV